MKKIILLLAVITTFLTSCSDESKIKTQIKDYVKTNFKDPSSYEVMEFKIDTFTMKDIAEFQIEIYNDVYIENDKKSLEMYTKFYNDHKNFNSEYGNNMFDLDNDISYINQYKKSIDSVNNLITKISKFKKDTTIGYYSVKNKYRAKNSFGGYDIDSIHYVFDSNFKLICIKGTEEFCLFKDKLLKLNN